TALLLWSTSLRRPASGNGSAASPLPLLARLCCTPVIAERTTIPRPRGCSERPNRPGSGSGAPLRCASTASGEGRRAPATLVIRDQLLAALHAALDAAGFPTPPGGVELTTPPDPSHGDFTTNLALQLAGPLGTPPRDVAAKLVVELERARPPHLERVEVAGPGFLNLHLAPTWLHEVLLAV